MKKQMKMSGIGFYLLVLAVIFCAVYFSGNIESSSSDSYSIANLKKDLGNGNVTSASISQNQEIPTGEVVVKLKSGKNVDFYVSDVKDVQELLDQWNVSYKLGDVKKTSWVITTLLPYGLGFVAIFLLFSFLSAQSANSGGGNSKMMNFGKSRARRIDPEEPHAKRFKDVAGLKEEKEELEEIVDFLANPGRYTDVGARIPKGIILVGPPGTGKTLLAKAVAGEAGVPFFSLSGSDFVEMFVGVGASRVRDMFAEAKKNAPCIVFIDEIDAVARKRGSGLGGGHDEREQTLNQMLVEMDGFGVNEGIIVMAATNRVDILDPAILRPGRFDRKVTVGRPDVRGREEILEVHAKGKPLGDDVDLKKIARTTVGFTGADLENLLNESAIVCAKEGRKFIEQEDISKSFIKIGIGKEKKSKIISEKDQKITAYHEAGHAILFHVLPDVGPVHMVSIIPTGSGAAGYTMPLPERDETFMTKGKMKQDIIASLGGRIAESLIFDDITTGASQDIKQATSTAKAMVTKYGFSENVGMINYADEDEVFIGRDFGRTSRDYSEDVAKTIDNEVKAIIDDAYAQAKSILEEHMDVLHKCAKLLLEKERIDREEFEALFEPDGVVLEKKEAVSEEVDVEPDSL
ncbi:MULTISPECIES: ATP-dependent zinc metalloprotease FtsH [Clostridia]|jgi:cell division protease FtsH|uniref:ATP-dependent zinc metalloprotease FtsH n=1 Tax=Butyribacter intestini TaxID=1703332 RepID=A0AAW3JT46_9FIRM|nr:MULTISPECIES: ATP-dependent zinc metalloprotease FtsH [Clostridia]KQC85828.1 cell division protein FtsH [Butyribacter intestini]RHP24127.1 ATP-dependent metallopeptidase FtsH/Yme1/Tma family protein [Clostridium sp. AF34-13]RHT93363.1 ATP-dependent metallopeptidase FtsH/Yme1/Tma family protein [Clostridium sp. AM27-31LB]RHU76927.1 ATP-dependent metallopeptidase FtsH/Yme1/Tma family protein [Butyribacter intestini]